MLVVDAQSDARDAWAHGVIAPRDARRPIVLCTNDNDTTHLRHAVAAGVFACVVAGLAPERIRAIPGIAVARFKHEQALRLKWGDARSNLQERKVISRAKTLLIQRQSRSE